MKDLSKMRQAMQAHVQQMIEYSTDFAAQKRDQTPYWNLVHPTYIENWPVEMLSLSIPTVQMKLMLDDIIRLGSNIVELGEGFAKTPHNIDDIIQKLDNIIQQFPNGAFVRLGSRSAKDSYYAFQHGMRIFSGKEAIESLMACSERIYEDLKLAQLMEYEPSIILRQFVDIPKESEFRCFIQNNKLIGVSQYNYPDGYFQFIDENKDTIFWAIQSWYDRQFRRINILPNVVADVFIIPRVFGEGQTEWQVKLIEINPFYPGTDPCLYHWEFQNNELTIKPEQFFQYSKVK